jgi:hypothetical protein
MLSASVISASGYKAVFQRMLTGRLVGMVVCYLVADVNYFEAKLWHVPVVPFFCHLTE